MNKHSTLGGTIHKIPADLQEVLETNNSALEAWNSITPLARNEWVCWVESAKLIETRRRRIARTSKELSEGKRRPCCWIGCIHRTDKEISPSVKGLLNKKSSSRK